jgi:dCTP diphosphatase
MSNSTWDLSNAVSEIMAFREARDWGQFHRPKELAAGLAIEAAELQEVFLWREQETAEEFVTDEKRLHRAEEEIADVAIYLIMLAHDLGLDLPRVVSNKVEANDLRYSIENHRGVAHKADHSS